MNYLWTRLTTAVTHFDIGSRLGRAAKTVRHWVARARAWLDQPVVAPKQLKEYDWKGLQDRLARAAWNIYLLPWAAAGWLGGLVVRAWKLGVNMLKSGFDSGAKL